MKFLLFVVCIAVCLVGTSAFMGVKGAMRAHRSALHMADIVDTAVGAGSFNTLASALTSAGLVPTLKGEGPYTVFAPSDAAFAKLPPGLVDALMKDLPLLTQILTYHVVSGKVPASEVVKMDGADVATVNGKTAKVSIEGNTVKIGSATVVQTDVAADNGVIHVIDSVILPPGITLPTPAPAASGKKAAKATASIDVKKEPGITAPFGFFDPAGLCPDDPVLYKRYRESEIKHGRVAMLAFLGILIGESGFSLIGIDGPAIYQYQQAEGILNAWSWNVIGLTLAVEGYSIVNAWQPADETFRDTTALAGLKDDYTPGDLKWDPLNFAPADAEAYKTVQTKELNNGRLAMLAVAGIVAQELVTGQSIF